ncbi:hypothetical protein M0802_006287 [Mischocyttarus mexicanus]|nr:hypothetical protein M0802_006287 [Mischocyttarus mexicanus]
MKKKKMLLSLVTISKDPNSSNSEVRDKELEKGYPFGYTSCAFRKGDTVGIHILRLRVTSSCISAFIRNFSKGDSWSSATVYAILKKEESGGVEG